MSEKKNHHNIKTWEKHFILNHYHDTIDSSKPEPEFSHELSVMMADSRVQNWYCRENQSNWEKNPHQNTFNEHKLSGLWIKLHLYQAFFIEVCFVILWVNYSVINSLKRIVSFISHETIFENHCLVFIFCGKPSVQETTLLRTYRQLIPNFVNRSKMQNNNLSGAFVSSAKSWCHSCKSLKQF